MLELTPETHVTRQGQMNQLGFNGFVLGEYAEGWCFQPANPSNFACASMKENPQQIPPLQ